MENFRFIIAIFKWSLYLLILSPASSPSPDFFCQNPQACLSLPLLEPPYLPLCHISPPPSQFLLRWLSPSQLRLSSVAACLPSMLGTLHYTFLLMCMKEMQRKLSFVPATLFSGFRYLIWGIVDFAIFVSVIILLSLVTMVCTSRFFFCFLFLFLDHACHKLTIYELIIHFKDNCGLANAFMFKKIILCVTAIVYGPFTSFLTGIITL